MLKYSWKKHIIVLVLVISLLLTSCFGDGMDYHGEYPDLYSVAIHSIIGIYGYDFSEVKFDSKINVIDEDEQGRKLFSYQENSTVSTYNLIICQKTNDDYTYFYPDYNFISSSEDTFPEEEIEQLKEKNDWNKEINEYSCVKAKVTRKKPQGLINRKAVNKLYCFALGEDAYYPNSSIIYLISDNYGRELYTGYGKYSSKRVVVMLLNHPDGSYDENTSVMELKNYYSYQEELKAFKERNHWNQPLS